MKPLDFFLLVAEHRMLIKRIGLYYRKQSYQELEAQCPILIKAERCLAGKIDEIVDKCITQALEQAPSDAIENIYKQLNIQRPNESKEKEQHKDSK